MFDNSRRKFNYFLKFPLDFDLARAYNDFIVLGLLAQLVEQRTLNPWVAGSIPSQPIYHKRIPSINVLATLVEGIFLLLDFLSKLSSNLLLKALVFR